MDTPPITNVTQAAPKGGDKLWTVLSHLSVFLGVPFLLPLVVYLVMKNESQYVSENAREALNFHITVMIYLLCCLPLAFVFIGIPLAIVVGIATVVFAIIAAIKSADGLCYRYPMTVRIF